MYLEPTHVTSSKIECCKDRSECSEEVIVIVIPGRCMHRTVGNLGDRASLTLPADHTYMLNFLQSNY
jgi:hypothetical protein